MRASILILFLFTIKTYAQQGPGTTLTLQQSIDAALKNELTIRQSQTQMETARITLRQAKSNMLPDLIGTINHGMNQGRSIDPFTNAYINQQINFASYNLGSSVTLFNGFQLLNTVKQQRYAYSAAQMELQMTRDNITMQVILAYLQILSAEDQLRLAEAQAGLSRKQVERLETLHKDGAIPPSQLYDLRGQLANDELAIVNANNALEAAKLSLVQLMNIPYDRNLKVERLNADQLSLVYEGDAQSIYNSALGQLAIVKAADFRRQSANLAVKAARGGYSPSFFLSGNFNTNYSSAARTETLVNVVDVSSDNYVIINGNKVPVVTPQANFASSKISYGS
ncbi:MAG TPA: TolC family protein, partial [Chitinophagaceae bacterium]|nr:TolC family protein [Chitinophagaceae bacterium]